MFTYNKQSKFEVKEARVDLKRNRLHLRHFIYNTIDKDLIYIYIYSLVRSPSSKQF